jgi:tripartite-type tricarboxylate transporter receptor subunit TctC
MTNSNNKPIQLKQTGLRKSLLLTAASIGLFGLTASLSLSAQAQSAGTYPNKPIRIIIGFPAGGPLDQHARLLSTRLEQLLGTQVVVDYRAGAGGAIGAEAVARSAPDGYTLLLANTGTMVINPALYPKLPYNMNTDLVAVARTAQQPLAFLVHPSVPANNLTEFVAYAKKNPGKLNYGSAGNGGISHLVPEMFKKESSIFMVHIPYRGSAPAFTDLIAGQVQFMAESIPAATQYVKQGKVKALAVTSAQRNQALPDTQTVIEAGFKGFEVVGFYGFLAPAKTPKEILTKLSEAFQKALETPEIRTRMITQGADPAFLNADQFAKFLRDETPKWNKAVKDSGAKVD